MKTLSLLTLLLYCGLLFPTAGPFVNNKLVELQNKHKLFTFSVQTPTGQSGKCLSDQPDDDDAALLVTELPTLPAASTELIQSICTVRLERLILPFSARAPPHLLI